MCRRSTCLFPAQRIYNFLETALTLLSQPASKNLPIFSDSVLQTLTEDAQSLGVIQHMKQFSHVVRSVIPILVPPIMTQKFQ